MMPTSNRLAQMLLGAFEQQQGALFRERGTIATDHEAMDAWLMAVATYAISIDIPREALGAELLGFYDAIVEEAKRRGRRGGPAGEA